MMKVTELRRIDLSASLKKMLQFRLSFLILMSLILGGTSQYIYTYKLPLYILSLIILGTQLVSRDRHNLSALLCGPIVCFLTFFGMFVLYYIPLPVTFWSALEGRSLITDGYSAINESPSWAPISIYPERVLLGLFDFIPVISVVLLTMTTKVINEIKFAKYCILFGVFLSVCVGVLQLLIEEAFSLYEIYNKNRPIGFFSNTNHFACLLTMSLPLCWLFWQDFVSGKVGKSILMGCFSLSVTGIVLTGSSAGYVILFFALLFTPVILFKRLNYTKPMIVLFLLFTSMLLVDFFILSGEFSTLLGKFSNTSSIARPEIFKTTILMIEDFGLFGAGPGSFEDLYKMYESHDTIKSKFVNNVHNDFLQIWFEFGILGIGFFIACVLSLIGIVLKMSKMPREVNRRTGIFLLILIIPILYSIVDYPLRTISISVVFMFFVSLVCRELNPE